MDKICILTFEKSKVALPYAFISKPFKSEDDNKQKWY